MATNDQITRVWKVLYQPARTRKLLEHVNNVDVLMNLNWQRTIPANDARARAGTGPNWFYPANGKVNESVLKAADQCEKIAALLLDIQRDLAPVDFPAADKRHLRAGLAAQADAWRARARVWRAPGKPNVEAASAAIVKHERTSFKELGRVTAYFKQVGPS